MPRQMKPNCRLVQLTNVPDDLADRIARAAHIRGLSMGEYVVKLYQLHEAMRGVTDPANKAPAVMRDVTQATLRELGLQSVRD